MKQLGVLLLPPGCNAGSPSGYSPASVSLVPGDFYIQLGGHGERHCEITKLFCLRTEQIDTGQNSVEPGPRKTESSTLTTVVNCPNAGSVAGM